MAELCGSLLHPAKRQKTDESIVEKRRYIDDNGEFDRMVADARRQSNGDRKKECQILTERVLTNLLIKLRKDRDSKMECKPSFAAYDDDQNKPCRAVAKVEDDVAWPTLPAEEVMRMARDNGLSDPILIIRKSLSRSDLCLHQARFSMPIARVSKSDKFLNRKERHQMDISHKYDGRVMLVDPKYMEIIEIELKKWKNSYMLARNWGRYLRKIKNDANYGNIFEVGRRVQVWGFRKSYTTEIWLALQFVV